jgi:hypothetical protein
VHRIDNPRARIDEAVALLDSVVAALREAGAPEPISTKPHSVAWQGSFAMACADGRVWLCAEDGTDLYISRTVTNARAFIPALLRNQKVRK